MFYFYLLHLFIVCMHVSVVYVYICDSMWMCYCVYTCVYYMGVLFCVCMGICMCMCMPCCVCGHPRRLTGINSFILPCGFWDPNSGSDSIHLYPLSISCQSPCFVCLFEADLMYSRLVLNSLFSSKWPWISNHHTFSSEVLGSQSMYTMPYLWSAWDGTLGFAQAHYQTELLH